jgi:hypothetical protein
MTICVAVRVADGLVARTQPAAAVLAEVVCDALNIYRQAAQRCCNSSAARRAHLADYDDV